MVRPRREQPKKLAAKLLAIRQNLGMSQTEMARGLKLKVSYTVISGYELGTNEPNLLVLLRYAKLAKVSMETLVDDKAKLP